MWAFKTDGQYCILLCIIEALTWNKTQIPSFQPCRRILSDKTYSSVRAVPLQWVKFTLWWATATSLRLTPKNLSSSFSSLTVPLRNRCVSLRKACFMHLKRCGQTRIYMHTHACTHTRTLHRCKNSSFTVNVQNVVYWRRNVLVKKACCSRTLLIIDWKSLVLVNKGLTKPCVLFIGESTIL